MKLTAKERATECRDIWNAVTSSTGFMQPSMAEFLTAGTVSHMLAVSVWLKF